MGIALPNITSKLIGSFGYFLEPILLINILSKSYSIDYITTEYGIITGYILPLLLLPSFFSMSITQSILPSISYDYNKGNLKRIKFKIKYSIILIFIISLFILIPLFIYPKFFLKLLYQISNEKSLLLTSI